LKTSFSIYKYRKRTPQLKEYIDDRQYLFWYSPAPKSETVSDELLVETVLNYGSMVLEKAKDEKKTIMN